MSDPSVPFVPLESRSPQQQQLSRTPNDALEREDCPETAAASCRLATPPIIIVSAPQNEKEGFNSDRKSMSHFQNEERYLPSSFRIQTLANDSYDSGMASYNARRTPTDTSDVSPLQLSSSSTTNQQSSDEISDTLEKTEGSRSWKEWIILHKFRIGLAFSVMGITFILVTLTLRQKSQRG